MPWLTIRISTPSPTESRTMSGTRRRSATAWREADGVPDQAPVGERGRDVEDPVDGTGCRGARSKPASTAVSNRAMLEPNGWAGSNPSGRAVTPGPERRLARDARPGMAKASGASTAARSGSPPKAGHHALKAQNAHSGPVRGRKSSEAQARSTAWYTASVRRGRKRMDCSDGRVSMISPVLRYRSWMRAGRRPNSLLAQEGVEVDAAEALLLVVDRRGPGRSCSR